MGFAKRMWEEEQGRRYHTSEDAVCPKCFTDRGIRSFIEAHLEHKRCSICKRFAKKPMATSADKLLQFFLGKVDEHFQDAEGTAPYDGEDCKWMLTTWNMHDIVFRELEGIAEQRTLKWLYQRLKDDIAYCKRDWQIMSPGEALAFGWEQFSHAVKHETRFLFFDNKRDIADDTEPFLVRPERVLQELGKVIIGCGLVRNINADYRIFRVRWHKAGATYTEPVDLGPPPDKSARSAGRMNAPGIVLMYGSFERDTALAECASASGEYSVGTFQLLRPVRVVDVTSIPAVPSIFEEGPRESLEFLHRFAEDVSQPFTPDAEIHIEYTPTQVVSEYLRHRLHDRDGQQVEGVIYKSAKRPNGTNIALFITSRQVEGVPSSYWERKEPVLRLVDVEEVLIP